MDIWSGARADKYKVKPRVVEALQNLKNEGLIADWLVLNQHTELEDKGVGFMVYLQGGLIMPLCVIGTNGGKRSKRRIELHFYNRGALPRFVLIVPQRKKNDLRGIKRRIARTIAYYTKQTYAFYGGCSRPPQAPTKKIVEENYNPHRSVVLVLRSLQACAHIAAFIESRPCGQLDDAGHDFVVFLRHGLCFAIQVKGYGKERRSNLHKICHEHRRKHPLVKFILVVRWKNKHHLRLAQKRVALAIEGQAHHAINAYT